LWGTCMPHSGVSFWDTLLMSAPASEASLAPASQPVQITDSEQLDSYDCHHDDRSHGQGIWASPDRGPGAGWWPASAAQVHASTHRSDRTAKRRRQPRPAPVGPVRAPAAEATSVGTEPGAAPRGASPGRFARSPVRRTAP
jgi:hypothetical protein